MSAGFRICSLFYCSRVRPKGYSMYDTKHIMNIIFTPPLLGQDMTRPIFKRSLSGLNSEFSF